MPERQSQADPKGLKNLDWRSKRLTSGPTGNPKASISIYSFCNNPFGLLLMQVLLFLLMCSFCLFCTSLPPRDSLAHVIWLWVNIVLPCNVLTKITNLNQLILWLDGMFQIHKQVLGWKKLKDEFEKSLTREELFGNFLITKVICFWADCISHRPTNRCRSRLVPYLYGLKHHTVEILWRCYRLWRYETNNKGR